VDIVYESVGGKTFDACVSNLAVKGRLIVVGFISGYQDQSGWQNEGGKGMSLTGRLLGKSGSVRGFFVMHYKDKMKKYSDMLLSLLQGYSSYYCG
jgi:NADPH-dependent curcumin reductase CurA